MAVRNYFSHVNPDGEAAITLWKSGYQLPSWWGEFETNNYIRSIAAGCSPDAAWQAWMNSSGHRTHILALDPFTTETSYGIGYYYDINNAYKYTGHHHRAASFPASSLPSPRQRAAHKSPRRKSQWKARRTIRKPAASKCASKCERYRRLPAATGVGNWSTSLNGMTARGENTIRARSLDASGNEITSDRAVSYVEMGELTINIAAAAR